MRRRIFLVLVIAIITGIHPVFAQSGDDEPVKPAAPKKIVKETEIVINLNFVSDDELTDALETATDIELVNEETAKAEESDIDPNQGK